MANTFKPDFIIIPMSVILNKNLQPLDYIVYWAVYFLSTLKDWECKASNKTLAEMVWDRNQRSISNSLTRLEAEWFLSRKTVVSNWETKRLSITPIVTFVKGVSSDDDRGVIKWWRGVSSNDEQNNNIYNNNILQIPLPEETLPVKKDLDRKQLVNKLLSKWNSYNPAIGYSNITQRKSVEAMLDAMPLEEAERLIETAISVQWQPFAPVITTPYELRQKIIKLKNFIERQVWN